MPLLGSFDKALPAPIRVRLENDAALNLWVLAWDAHALMSAPLNVFQANIFFPEPNTLAYSEHQLGQVPLFGPLWFLTGNPVVAFNLLYLASFVLTGVTTFMLVRYWLNDAPAAFIAGLLFAYTPPRLAHHFHTQLLAIWWLPLTLLALERFLRKPTVLRAALLAISFTMQWLCSVYLGWLLTVAVLVYLTAVAVTRTELLRSSRVWLFGAGAGIGSAPLILPTLLPYLQVTKRWSFQWPTSDLISHSAEPASFLNVSPANLLYGTALRPFEQTGGVEQQLFLGFVPLILATAGVLSVCVGGSTSPRSSISSRWLVGAMLALAAVSLVLSFGPYVSADLTIPLPYLALYQWLPGFQAMRNPARFIFVIAFAVAVLSALGVARLRQLTHGRARQAVSLAIGLVCLAELFAPASVYSITPIDPVASDYLRISKPGQPILELPTSREKAIPETPRMVASIEHWRPLINGFSGFRPPAWEGFMSTFQSAEPLVVADMLAGLGASTVVIHLDELSGGELARATGRAWEDAGFVQGVRTPRSMVWELSRVPVPVASDWLETELQLPRQASAGSEIVLRIFLRAPDGTLFNSGSVGAQSLTIRWESEDGETSSVAETDIGLPPVIPARPQTRVDVRTQAPDIPGRYGVVLAGPVAAEGRITLAGRATR